MVRKKYLKKEYQSLDFHFLFYLCVAFEEKLF
jgi:hypothetical protein